MRVRSLLLTLVAFGVTGAAAGPSHASTAAQRRTGALAFARISADTARDLQAGAPRAELTGQTRRVLASGCLDVWRGAPLVRREDLGDIYFEAIGGGLWTVDGPIFARWVRRLEASSAIAAVPLLARAVRALRRDLAGTDPLWRGFPHPCATVTAWRDAGWAAAATPAELVRSRRFLAAPEPERRFPGPVEGASMVLEHELSSRAGAAVALLERRFDEPDERVLYDTRGCDPVAALVLDDGGEQPCAPDGT